jgi:hypothetical protein
MMTEYLNSCSSDLPPIPEFKCAPSPKRLTESYWFVVKVGYEGSYPFPGSVFDKNQNLIGKGLFYEDGHIKIEREIPK